MTDLVIDAVPRGDGARDAAVPYLAILLVTALWEWVSYHGGWMERWTRLGVPYPARMRDRYEKRRADFENRGS